MFFYQDLFSRIFFTDFIYGFSRILLTDFHEFYLRIFTDFIYGFSRILFTDLSEVTLSEKNP